MTRYALVQDTQTGDVFAVNETAKQMTEALYYGDWQTDDELDTAKIEATPWQFDYPTAGTADDGQPFDLDDQSLRYLYEWGD